MSKTLKLVRKMKQWILKIRLKHTEEGGVKVLEIHVLKNRFIDNVVGCKITIPDK